MRAFLITLTLVAVSFKLLGALDLPWLWVLSPLWLPLSLHLLIITLAVLIRKP